MARVEDDHADRRDLVTFLVEQLNGRSTTMVDVDTRQIPARTLLCLERHVDGEPGSWALGKEFVGILQERPMPRIEGPAGEVFSIYHGDVGEDGDGRVEWCRPVPPDRAKELAGRYPELALRAEPAHDEVYVHL